jgi:hypothetical protein
MIAPSLFAGWQRAEVLLLAIFAQLTLLTLVGLLVAHRLGCLAGRPPGQRAKPTQASTNRTTVAPGPTHDEDPHITLRRLAGQAAGRPIGDLSPLRGSLNPIYLLFREDDTRRRLLLAAGPAQAALRAEGVRSRLLPRRRYPSHVLAPDDVAAAWTALAPRLDLPAEPPPVARWTLVELPPEELM